MIPSSEGEGWKHFETDFLQPLIEVKYSTPEKTVRFQPGAIAYINYRNSHLLPTWFDKYCAELTLFCDYLYAGKRDETTEFPYIRETDKEIVITLVSCVRIWRKILGLTHDSAYTL